MRDWINFPLVSIDCSPSRQNVCLKNRPFKNFHNLFKTVCYVGISSARINDVSMSYEVKIVESLKATHAFLKEIFSWN